MAMNPKMPMVMEGIPVMTSAMKRTVAPMRPSDSARNSPQTRPTGMVAAMAMPPMTKVPAMAFQIPPPGIPSGTVEWMKKSVFQAGRPLTTT